MKIILVCLFSFFTVASFCQSKDESIIKTILTDQTAAWNKGDVESFMNGYWENDSLMFIGKSGVTYGYKNTLENYKKNYPSKDAMGALSFTLIQLKQISKNYYHVTGRWHLKRSIGDIGGHYTLLFQKINGRWVIVSDHSS